MTTNDPSGFKATGSTIFSTANFLLAYSKNKDFMVFYSRQERIVAKILEKDRAVLKWFRPYKKENFSIEYQYRGDRHPYIPDFISETKDKLYIIEPKSKAEIEDDVVKAKAKAALELIKEMNKASKKRWEYLLIPHDRITSSVNTFKKLVNQAVNLSNVL